MAMLVGKADSGRQLVAVVETNIGDQPKCPPREWLEVVTVLWKCSEKIAAQGKHAIFALRTMAAVNGLAF